jgi:lipopolysaccharide export system protein LptA
MIVEQEQDSIFIAADTLFSARLTDLYGAKDSVVKKDTLKGVKIVDTKTKDSTNRYFEAFRHVRVFSDSLQAVCDSMFYSFKDSVFRLYDDPVVWSNENQITGDTILLFTKNKKADRMQAFKNSFIASFINQKYSTR